MSNTTKDKEKVIIGQKDISNFREYIDKKYSSLPLEKREAILYNSVAYVVERDLSTHTLPNQDRIAKDLVERVLFEKKEDLLTDTILKEDWREVEEALPIDTEEYPSVEPSLGNLSSPQSRTFSWILLLATSLMFFGGFLLHNNPPMEEKVSIEAVEKKTTANTLPAHIIQRFQKPNNHFPSYFYYRPIDESSLKEYLKGRQSLLKEEPYFSEILYTARKFDLNPLLLFAIAGHEQAFVPKDHPSSSLIVNNPFNVFGSWQVYNTSLQQTSEITARTIYSSLADLPPLIDPFFWMNRRYAEDPNWWKGVKAIFQSLQSIA